MLYTLVYLEAATEIGSMELFRNYVTWLRSIFICFNIDVDDLIGTLETLQEIFVERGDAVQAEYLEDLLRLIDSMEDVPASRLKEDNPFKAMAEDYLKRLLAQDQSGATDLIFNAADAGIPIPNLYMNVLQPMSARSRQALADQPDIHPAGTLLHRCDENDHVAAIPLPHPAAEQWPAPDCHLHRW